MSLTILTTPAVPLSVKNVSFWGAAFNPQVFTLQRKDFIVTQTSRSSATVVRLQLPGALTTTQLGVLPGKYVRVKTATYDFIGTVLSAGLESANTAVYVNVPVALVGTDLVGGFMNSSDLNAGYKVQVDVTIAGQVITARYTPDIYGFVRIDLGSYLKAYTSSADEAMNYNLLYSIDNSRFAAYTLVFSEYYNQSVIFPGLAVTDTYYIVYAALQLGQYGSNLAQHVTFKNEINPDKKAKFLTHVKQPIFFSGYPMDLSYIFGNDMVGRTARASIATLDVNKNPIAGFAANAFLANSGGDILLINPTDYLLTSNTSFTAGSTSYTYPMSSAVGVWRMPLLDAMLPTVEYVQVFVYYVDASGVAIQITETKIVKVSNNTCGTDGVYLKWINRLGGWDYFLFTYNNEYSTDISQTTIDRLILDYSTQNSTQDVLAKSSQEKIKIGKSGVDSDTMRMLNGLLSSPKVYMLTGYNPQVWQTVVVDTKGTTLYTNKEYFGDFETTIKLPTLNIQTA